MSDKDNNPGATPRSPFNSPRLAPNNGAAGRSPNSTRREEMYPQGHPRLLDQQRITANTRPRREDPA
jgi:hypothetical protein